MTQLLVRPLRAADDELLETATLGNVNWCGDRLTRADVKAQPELAHYLRIDPGRGDLGLVAEDAGEPAAVAWLIFATPDHPGYGFVTPDIPELSLWGRADLRGQGVGRRLLRLVLRECDDRGFPGVSLSVETGDPARHLYATEGFVDVPGREADGVMIRGRLTGG